MSLKSVLESLSFKSLNGRLAGMFALVTIGTLGAVGAYLYLSLAVLLRENDDGHLVRAVNAARHRLGQYNSLQALRDDAYPFMNLASGRDNQELVLILRSVQGEQLFEAHHAYIPMPAMTPVPADAPFTANALVNWHSANGENARVGSAYGLLANGKDQVEIIGAFRSSGRASLLFMYRSRIIVGMITGTTIAVFLSLILVRTGFRPLREIASKAASITVNRLQTRLDAKSAPLELQELVTAMNAMLNRIEDGFQRLSQFSSDVAHEFRTPISNLMVQTQVALTKTRTDDEYQILLASNIEEFERLSRMVENMLFLARADNARVALRTVRFDVGTELTRIADYFQGLADERNVTIRTNYGQSDGDVTGNNVKLLADPILFRRAVHNLLANAVRFTPPGASIDLTVAQHDDEVVVSVLNPGPGIAPEHLPSLFDRFYRTDPSRSDSALSAGLGLAIVRSIVQLHNGRVNVESYVDGITTFCMFFPVGDEAEEREKTVLA
jgi:two-component system heavy metal sensor histidine kinase CusS